MNNFTCNDCAGFCCVNPPILNTEEEIKTVKKFNVKLYAFKDKKGYIIAIARKNKKCPLLMENGLCVIHDDKPIVCKQMQCQFLNLNKSDALNKVANWEPPLNVSDTTHKDLHYFDKKTVKKYNCKILTINDFIINNMTVDFKTYSTFITKILEKNSC